MKLTGLFLGLATVIAAWKFGRAAERAASALQIRAHSQAEIDEQIATAMFNENLPDWDDDDDDVPDGTLH